MAPQKKSISQDRKRVSSEKHEVAYTGSKVKGGSKAVVEAKKKLGRTTSRAKVMKKAKELS